MESHSVTQAVVQSVISAHCSLDLRGSNNPPASASRETGSTGVQHQTWTIFVFFFVEMGFHHIAQAGLLGSSNLPTSASQSAGITGMSHCAWLMRAFFMFMLGIDLHKQEQC